MWFLSIKLHGNFIKIALRHGCSPVNLLHIFKTIFPKARIHCETFLSEHFMKYVFHDFHCVNYREMFMIYLLKPFMKYENSENRFSEFSLSWKAFLLNLFSCLINSFIINDVYKNLKENVNAKVKSKHKVVFRTLYWKNWKVDSSSFFRIMNEKDFNFDAITRFQAY